MVFLTSIDILDTGFLGKTTRTNQLGADNRVNSGNALRLKGVEIELNSSANLDKETSPGRVTGPEVSFISANAREFVMTLYLNSNNIDTNNVWGVNDMSLLDDIIRLPETRGWKAIYYPVDNTAVDSGANTTRKRNSQLIYWMGSADTSELQGDIDIDLWTGSTSVSGKDLTDVNYISVRFENASIKQDGDSSSIVVTLNGVITG